MREAIERFVQSRPFPALGPEPDPKRLPARKTRPLRGIARKLRLNMKAGRANLVTCRSGGAGAPKCFTPLQKGDRRGRNDARLKTARSGGVWHGTRRVLDIQARRNGCCEVTDWAAFAAILGPQEDMPMNPF